MSLAPLPVGPEAQSGEQGAGEGNSFRKRKLSQLQSEAEPTPGRAEDLSAESVEDGYPEDDLVDDPQGYVDDEGDAGDEVEAAELESDEELDQSEEDTEAEGDETVEGLKAEKLRLEQKISQITENRKQIEQDFSDNIAETIVMRHQLEDTVQNVQAQGQFWLNLANQQAAKFENLDWSRVPPDEVAAVKLQAQQAQANRNQIIQHFKAQGERIAAQVEHAKKREAEVAQTVLARRIPGWGNEVYGKLREHAVSLGYNADDFNDLTDWRVMDLIHRDYQNSQAVQTVQGIRRKRKAKPPRNRNGRPQPRSADGKYRNARDDAFDNPGDKVSFREMKRQQMARERARGGR